MNSADLSAAFQAGSNAKPESMNLMLLGIFSASLFLFAAWVLITAFRGISSGQVSWKQLGSITGRTVLLILFCLWLALS
ncbi:TIGR03758 family integrating conjugative element protein [Yersinia enterocolitica]|uniref:TIGR03758 family integrating conjugative element protein n=1 Tax=Yersinia massiliensis TaxID=419257 RepID=UPI001CFF1173|nr:TIGR03758 family integrating conjugative element protein [Yersinia massiliensis]MCB5308789.1 TIGR03758 family integrating conjugative element protein [Yersinia massiliensis]